MKNKFSVGVWTFGSCLDRFCAGGYHEPRSFAEKIENASRVKGLDGVEVHYNGDFDKENFKEAKKIIENSNLQISAVNCEIFGERKYKNGALSSNKKEIREDAISVVKKAAETSKILEASLVNIWPGAEGFDYPFQVEHSQVWELFIGSLKECISDYPEVKFTLEYKPREPRVRSLLDNASRTLLVIKELDADNIGVTIDFGHSMMAKENPAEAASIINYYDRLFHLHLNDNSRDWDDDLMVGTYHLWETLELLYYLKKFKYQGWFGFDVFPRREDQIQSVEYNIEIIKKMDNLIDSMDEEELSDALNNRNALTAYEILKEILFT